MFSPEVEKIPLGKSGVDFSILFQRELIKKSELPANRWIEIYSGKFRRIIEKDPNLLNDYQKDPSATLAKITTQLENNQS